MKRIISISVLLLIIASCMNEAPAASDTFNKVVALEELVGIEITNIRGTVTVVDNTGDVSNITIEASKKGWSQFDLDSVEILVTEKNNRLIVETSEKRSADVTVNLTVKVPSVDFTVDVFNTSGNVLISKCNVLNDIKVKTGNLSIFDCFSIKKANVESGNANISGTDSILELKVNKGMIQILIEKLSADGMTLSVETGSIQAVIDPSTDYASIFSETTNGQLVNPKNIPLTRDSSTDYSIDFTVQTGDVILSLPASKDPSNDIIPEPDTTADPNIR